MFKREWNSLTSGNHGRYVLAVLALYNAPMVFDDVAILTQYEAGRVKDALADIREMFLQLSEVGPETTFQLGALTRAFVFEQSKKLDLLFDSKRAGREVSRSIFQRTQFYRNSATALSD